MWRNNIDISIHSKHIEVSRNYFHPEYTVTGGYHQEARRLVVIRTYCEALCRTSNGETLLDNRISLPEGNEIQNGPF